MSDIEAKKAQKEIALAEKEAKKLIKEEAEAPEREALVSCRVLIGMDQAEFSRARASDFGHRDGIVI